MVEFGQDHGLDTTAEQMKHLHDESGAEKQMESRHKGRGMRFAMAVHHTREIMSVLSTISVVVIAIFGLLEYTESRQEARRERSLDLVEQWVTRGYEERFARISEFVDERLLEATVNFGTGFDAETERMAKRNLGFTWAEALKEERYPRSVEIKDDVDKIVFFFSRVEICVQGNLCDEEVILRYFGELVSSFWRYFVGYADYQVRHDYRQYGSYVNALVGRL